MGHLASARSAATSKPGIKAATLEGNFISQKNLPNVQIIFKTPKTQPRRRCEFIRTTRLHLGRANKFAPAQATTPG
jgi:hypothetical protein